MSTTEKEEIAFIKVLQRYLVKDRLPTGIEFWVVPDMSKFATSILEYFKNEKQK